MRAIPISKLGSELTNMPGPVRIFILAPNKELYDIGFHSIAGLTVHSSCFPPDARLGGTAQRCEFITQYYGEGQASAMDNIYVEGAVFDFVKELEKI